MRLPSINNCPGCGGSNSYNQSSQGNSLKSHRNRPEPRRSVHERLGPIRQVNFEDQVEENQIDQAQNPQ